jgi:hypothetical protein
VATKKWVVETNPKWRLGDSDTVMYEWINNNIRNKHE